MMIKKLFSVALLGTILWVGAFLGGGQPTALAASAPMAITETVSQTVSDDLSNLELSIDRFLTSIPSDYYTIASVEGLKNQLRMSQTLLVDVREQSEYQSGHIPKAINIRSKRWRIAWIKSRMIALWCCTAPPVIDRQWE